MSLSMPARMLLKARILRLREDFPKVEFELMCLGNAPEEDPGALWCIRTSIPYRHGFEALIEGGLLVPLASGEGPNTFALGHVRTDQLHLLVNAMEQALSPTINLFPMLLHLVQPVALTEDELPLDSLLLDLQPSTT